MAQAALVSRISQDVIKEQMTDPDPSGASHAPQATTLLSGNLEVERQAFRQLGYFEEVMDTLLSSRKASTKRSYNCTWAKFAFWCHGHGVRESRPKIKQYYNSYRKG